MCGITAISRVAERSSINDPRSFMRIAALAIESRGRDATGFAWCDSDKSSWYWKKPGPATEIVDLAPLDRDMQTAIGHTRWATQGDVKDNENNHPVVDDGVMLVHNGVIDNDWELYAWLDKDFIPKAQVDSQVAATMLAFPAAFHAKHPTDLLRMIEGTAAFAWLHTSQPGVLHLARLSGRPMTIGWTRRGDLVMSSTPQSLRTLAHWANVKIRKIREIDEGTYLRVIDGEIVEETSFNAIGPRRKSHFLSYQQPKSYIPGLKGALTSTPPGWDSVLYDADCRYYDALNDLTEDELAVHLLTCTLPIDRCDLCRSEYDDEDLFDDEVFDEDLFFADDESAEDLFFGEPMIDALNEFGLVRVGHKRTEQPGWRLLKGT